MEADEIQSLFQRQLPVPALAADVMSDHPAAGGMVWQVVHGVKSGF